MRKIFIGVFVLSFLGGIATTFDDASAKSINVSSVCRKVINNYLTDGSKKRPNHSALALGVSADGGCYWEAYSNRKSIADAKTRALRVCRRYVVSHKIKMAKKCKIYGVNKKMFGL